jgi:exodeoxyribonuclease VII large subunit
MGLASTTTGVITVAEYSGRLVRALRTVGGGIVEGEVQRPKSTPGGMLVFDLTDGTAKLACKVFRSQVRVLEHQPRHGDLVQVRVDRPDLWMEAGKVDVIVADVRLAGEGELLRRREELLRRLTAEGLCDPARRRPLPRFPRAVGVIAGKGSDGLRDVITALQHRFPPVHVVTCTAIVQGVRAPLDVVDALARLDAHPLVDVIVIARGGGSVQDLVAFDDERLCRAVFACDTPVIAAIGHTDNVPVCNHVAWASETPSRSSELAVSSATALRQDLQLAAAQLAPLPERLPTLRGSVAGVVLDAPSALRARQMEVAGTAADLREADRGFFAARDAGLARAREALATIPGRIPDIAYIEGLGGRLDTRAVAFFSERTERSRATGDFTVAVKATLHEDAKHVRVAADELRVVPVALDAQALAADSSARMDIDARRRLVNARRAVAHVIALLEAGDPRRRGWVLPTDEAGAVLRSAQALAVGDRLTLSFHDGAAGAVIRTISDPEAT